MKRADFTRLVKGFAKTTQRITESTLRLNMPIQSSTNVYEFPILVNDLAKGTSAPDPEEIRLNQNDIFSIREIGLFYRAKYKNNAQDAENIVLLSYVPHEILVKNNQNSNLESLFNGKLDISVNNVTYLTNFDTLKFKRQPRTQINASNVITQFFDQDYKDFYAMQPNILLQGSSSNKIRLELPTSIDPITINPVMSSGRDNSDQLIIDKITFVFRGFLLQNAAQYQGAKIPVLKR
jgi:hypothetical protein